MRAAYKILIVVVFPMLVLAGYQFLTVQQTFNLVEDVRSSIFVESAREVKYAGDVLFMTGVINSILFEIHIAAELGDSDALSKGIQRYREIQLQRYYSLQKLKETVGGADNSLFDFIQLLDSGRDEKVAKIESEVKEIDSLNEKIIALAAKPIAEEGDDSLYAAILSSNEKTRVLAEDLAVFTNDRYIKIEETSQLVGETENRAENTLNMILLMGYLLAAIMVLFVYSLIVRPLERFAHAIEVRSMEKIDWRSFEAMRKDEIGIIYQALDGFLRIETQTAKTAPAESVKKKKKGKASLKKN